MRGPVDYIIVAFDGNNFKGDILAELEKSVANGTIAVLALGLIAKDSDGTVASVSMTEGVQKITANFTLDDNLITEDDVEEVGELLEPNTSAGILIVEHLWAKGLKKAIIDAGGQLLIDGRIHPDAAEELNKEDN